VARIRPFGATSFGKLLSVRPWRKDYGLAFFPPRFTISGRVFDETARRPQRDLQVLLVTATMDILWNAASHGKPPTNLNVLAASVFGTTETHKAEPGFGCRSRTTMTASSTTATSAYRRHRSGSRPTQRELRRTFSRLAMGALVFEQLTRLDFPNDEMRCSTERPKDIGFVP
jgi:hypothetical protein